MTRQKSPKPLRSGARPYRHPAFQAALRCSLKAALRNSPPRAAQTVLAPSAFSVRFSASLSRGIRGDILSPLLLQPRKDCRGHQARRTESAMDGRLRPEAPGRCSRPSTQRAWWVREPEGQSVRVSFLFRGFFFGQAKKNLLADRRNKKKQKETKRNRILSAACK